MTTSSLAITEYEIELDMRSKEIVRGHLDLGGSNPSGETIAVNSYYIERGGKPSFPIIGEFHYVRYPADRWDEEIRKIKAGGINTIGTYVFWNIHERTEGTFDWSGDLNLRRFVELCGKNGMDLIVRMGPFCHGEIRNGGLPDWLYGRTFDVRSNDPEYLAYVDRLYREIAAQVRGELYKDGGPIIGVQLENEFQHSAAPWEMTYPGAQKEWTVAERDVQVTHAGVSVSSIENSNAEYGADHMANLKLIAKRHGIEVPLYTATGWGNAAIVQRGSLPVTAGYVYPFWTPKPSPSPFYLYKDIHAQPDYMPVSYEPELYPSVPAEFGPGIVATWKRRPLARHDSVAPLIVRTLGSGSNGIGYYMYHGGSTPVFGHFYSEEVNGMPKINYDFQAPLGEFGQVRPHHRSLNLLHLFLASFGATLAPMKTTLPATNAVITPEDAKTLRYAVRSERESGFVFLHNFQDHLPTADIEDVAIRVDVGGESIRFPQTGSLSVPADSFAILPFNLQCDGVTLRHSTAVPLAKLGAGDGPGLFVLWSNKGLGSELAFDRSVTIAADEGVSIAERDGLKVVSGPDDAVYSLSADGTQFIVLPKAMAEQAWSDGAGGLLFSEATLLPNGDAIDVIARDQESVLIQMLPKRADEPIASRSDARVEAADPTHPAFSAVRVALSGAPPEIDIKPFGGRKFSVAVEGTFNDVHDVFLSIPYVGDRGLAFVDGALVADHFYYGEPWEISLKRFEKKLRDDPMTLVFHPTRPTYEYMLDLEQAGLKPDFAGKESYLKINPFAVSVERKATVDLR